MMIAHIVYIRDSLLNGILLVLIALNASNTFVNIVCPMAMKNIQYIRIVKNKTINKKILQYGINISIEENKEINNRHKNKSRVYVESEIKRI